MSRRWRSDLINGYSWDISTAALRTVTLRTVTRDFYSYSFTLLVPQRRRRVQARGAQGREPGGEEGDDQEQHRDGGERHWVRGVDLHEHARQNARDNERRE